MTLELFNINSAVRVLGPIVEVEFKLFCTQICRRSFRTVTCPAAIVVWPKFDLQQIVTLIERWPANCISLCHISLTESSQSTGDNVNNYTQQSALSSTITTNVANARSTMPIWRIFFQRGNGRRTTPVTLLAKHFGLITTKSGFRWTIFSTASSLIYNHTRKHVNKALWHDSKTFECRRRRLRLNKLLIDFTFHTRGKRITRWNLRIEYPVII